MSSKELKAHPLAHILKAIADGVTVQYKTHYTDVWTDFEPHIDSLPPSRELEWRIKPKPMVEKWRWVVKLPDGYLTLTNRYYKGTENVAMEFIQKVDSTKIEVEDDKG